MLVRLTKSIGRYANETGQKILPSEDGLRAEHRRSSTAPLVINLSFRDQSADWSWESVIPLCKSKGERIATASVRTGFAMTPLTRGAV